MTNEELTPELRNKIESMPREIQPDRDLWPDIETAIAESKIVRPDFAGNAETPAAAPIQWRRVGLVAAAAMLLIAVSSGVTMYLVAPAIDSDGELQLTEFETVAWQGFLAAERSYAQATDELLAQLDAQRDELQPETIAIVEETVRDIDAAIARAREALERDPANSHLVDKLTGMYRSKVNFLERMSRI